jgi:hypothetical protein
MFNLFLMGLKAWVLSYVNVARITSWFVRADLWWKGYRVAQLEENVAVIDPQEPTEAECNYLQLLRRTLDTQCLLPLFGNDIDPTQLGKIKEELYEFFRERYLQQKAQEATPGPREYTFEDVFIHARNDLVMVLWLDLCSADRIPLWYAMTGLTCVKPNLFVQVHRGGNQIVSEHANQLELFNAGIQALLAQENPDVKEWVEQVAAADGRKVA